MWPRREKELPGANVGVWALETQVRRGRTSLAIKRVIADAMQVQVAGDVAL